MNHNYKTQQELRDAQRAGKKFEFDGEVLNWNFITGPVDRYTLVEEPVKPTNKRKHADVIIAWANGEDIQVRTTPSSAWQNISDPLWNHSNEYRVKPKEEVKYYVARSNCFFNSHERNANIKMTFCGSTGDLVSVEKIK